MGLYTLHKTQERMLIKIAREILGGNNPNKHSLFKDFSYSSHRSTHWRRIKSFEELISDGFVTISDEKISLTEKGLDVVKNDLALVPQLKKGQKWNGIWHLVAYDIPEQNKKERNYFQKKIKAIGFYQLQNSLWVYPFNCEEEIGLMANELAITDYVAFMKTERVPFDKKVREHFGLN